VSDSYALIVAPRAARALSEDLPEPAAWAVIELITGPLLEHAQRMGHQLRNELAGIWSARRGDFRVLYRIDDVGREVTVLRVEHRRDIYRT